MHMAKQAARADETARVAAARAGEAGAFDALVRPLLPRLNAFAYRMVAHPEDAAELVQDALLKAHQRLASFRGDASFSTWLFAILTRRCLDHLNARRRWRRDAQAHTRESPDAPHHRVGAELRRPEARFEAREHIAFCFSCVSRSLPPEEAAAIFLREVFGFKNREAARVCGVSESVLRHRLSAGRQAMQDAFDDLCGLVNKRGVCHQCAGLRDHAPAENRGAPPPDLSGARDDAYRRRLTIVQDADLESGSSAALHRLMFRAVDAVERAAR
ncbi:MAG: RNA polymerase sigma factor [Myxococcales bacterium]|nr:RNA polymerase sigma factor [Myxococcales bacterium]MCB9752586.1 RNA polymerase sigma factor [Myxococcales bacterium]